MGVCAGFTTEVADGPPEREREIYIYIEREREIERAA